MKKGSSHVFSKRESRHLQPQLFHLLQTIKTKKQQQRTCSKTNTPSKNTHPQKTHTHKQTHTYALTHTHTLKTKTRTHPPNTGIQPTHTHPLSTTHKHTIVTRNEGCEWVRGRPQVGNGDRGWGRHSKHLIFEVFEEKIQSIQI